MKVLTFLGVVFVLNGFLVQRASAATLYFRSSSANINVGSLATITLYVDTQGKVINNAEAAVQFSNDLVDVVSVNYKSSIFSLWVEAPGYSNNSGQISFNGGLPDPGYKGGGGVLMSVIVKAKKPGTASFIFSDAAVRENDGLGTDILTGQAAASLIINGTEPNATAKPSEAKPTTTTTTTGNQTTAQTTSGSNLVVSSPTFPDSNSFYKVTGGTLSWSLPDKVSAVQTLLDNKPNSVPSIKYVPPIYQKNISSLADGVWYFHIRYLLNNTWSKISTYKFQIDTTPPKNLAVATESTNNCVVGLKVSAEDKLSGLDHFNLKIDDGESIKISAADAQNLIPWPQTTGTNHTVLLEAYDLAGNMATTTKRVKIEELIAPTLDDLPTQVNIGDRLEISGHSAYPDSNIKLSIKSDSGEESVVEVPTDRNGDFIFKGPVAQKEAVYQISAYVVGCSGANNSFSKESVVQVKSIGEAKNIAEPINMTLWFYVVGLLLELILILVLLLGWYKYMKLKEKQKPASRKSSGPALSLLLDQAHKDITTLDKLSTRKKLNRNEEKAIDSLKEMVNNMDTLKRRK